MGFKGVYFWSDDFCVLSEPGKNIDIDVGELIENVYNDLFNILVNAANAYIPRKKQKVYKYWWNEEFKLLKSNFMNSHRARVELAKLRTGNIFDAKAKAKLLYEIVLSSIKK